MKPLHIIVILVIGYLLGVKFAGPGQQLFSKLGL